MSSYIVESEIDDARGPCSETEMKNCYVTTIHRHQQGTQYDPLRPTLTHHPRKPVTCSWPGSVLSLRKQPIKRKAH